MCSLSCAAELGEPEALIEKTFPGKTAESLTFHDFRRVSLRSRNEVVAAIAHDAPLQGRRLDLLRDLSNEKLLTEPRVIGPLIEVLDRAAPEPPAPPVVITPDNATNISVALQILLQTTRRDCGDAVRSGREKRPEKVREIVAWWIRWWAANKDRHPMVDAELEKTLKQRIAAIESQLIKDMGRDYGEFRYLRPNQIRINFRDPLFDARIDSSRLALPPARRGSDGKRAQLNADEHTFLRLFMNFKTLLPPEEDRLPRSEEIPERWRALLVQVFTEDIPGTDINITVEAASKDGAFVRRVRESLSKLKPSKLR